MPTILRWNGYNFHFYSNEKGEPAHIHVTKAGITAKFWLPDGELAYNDGFKHNEIRAIIKAITEHCALLTEAWNEHHGH
jgi:hypothetical protein